MIHTIKISRIILLLAALLFVISCSQPERENIEVMTFNIRYENHYDGMFSWDSRKEMVFWLIEKYNPDILGIQEALKGQIDELVPVFYNRDRFMLADEGQFWLSENPGEPGSKGWDAACSRMVSWIKLKETSSGNEYFVFNTHFDHVGKEARLNSARLLVDSIRSIARRKPVILTGDFNCQAGSSPHKMLSQLLIDSKTDAENIDISVPTTYLGFPANLDEKNIIDHILLSKHFIVTEYEIVSDNSGGYFPSDHLPVRARLELMIP